MAKLYAVLRRRQGSVLCMQSGRRIGDNGGMPRTPTLVPGLRKVDLPEVRQAIPALHAYLRQCVLDGTLTPGTKLSQVALADQLGVSRTPLREVLRMLQEEGLVEIEPNQRTRVAGLMSRSWTTCTPAASCWRRSRCR